MNILLRYIYYTKLILIGYYYTMKKEEFKKRLDGICMSQKEFSDVIGYSYQAIKQWKDGKIPKWAEIVMDHLEDIQNCKLRHEKYNSIK